MIAGFPGKTWMFCAREGGFRLANIALLHKIPT